MSFIVINIVPFLIFSLIFPWLNGLPNGNLPGFWNLFGVFLMSTIVFLPYRILQMLIAHKVNWLYRLENENLSSNQKCQIQMVADSSSVGHLFGILFYLILALIGLCFIIL